MKRYRPGCKFLQHGVWYIRFGKDPAVRLGTTKELPTKQSVHQAAAPHIFNANRDDKFPSVTMGKVITRYQLEVMPKRADTAASYGSWIKNHIEPKWGSTPLVDFGRPVESVQAWLKALDLSTKSKREIKGILLRMVKSAELWGWIAQGPNLGNIVLKREKGEKVKKARVLTLPEFTLMAKHLEEPFKTMACVCYFHGLRVSELFGLQWKDVDWLRLQLEICTSVVNQIADSTKTSASEAIHPLDEAEISMLKAWRHASEFTKPTDYIFASPYQAGELPYSYTGFKQILWKACDDAGLKRITPHSFRHSFRSRLKDKGVSAEITTEMMRHTNYNQSREYGSHGGTVSPVVREVHCQLVREAMKSH
jgi:integrase